MAPRRRTRRHTCWKSWLYEYLTRFLNRCEFGFYTVFCTVLYTQVFREALPGRLSEVFFLVVLLQGVPLDQPRGKVATLIRGLLGLVAKELAGGLPGNQVAVVSEVN